MQFLRWLDQWAEEFFVSVMISLLVVCLGTEVFSRFILGQSFPWVEELCRYLFIWSCYIGVAIAVKRKEQLRVLVLMDLLKKRYPRLVRVCFILSELSFTAFCLTVFWFSLGLMKNMNQYPQVSAALEIDVKYAYYIIPLSMLLTAFRTMQGLVRDWRRGTLRFTEQED